MSEGKGRLIECYAMQLKRKKVGNELRLITEAYRETQKAGARLMGRAANIEKNILFS